MKKPLSATQKRNRYKIISKASFVGEFVSIGTPYIVMGAINYDEWFRGTEGWKVGVGGAIALALMGLAIFIITKKKEDNDSKTGGYITLLLGWLATAFVFLLLANIMHDIASIMFFGAIGIAGALGLEIVSKNYDEKADIYTKALEEYKVESVKNEVYEQAKKDVKLDIVDKESRNVRF